jgi:TldD protein
VLDLLTTLVDVAAGRCEYADARHVDSRNEWVRMRNGAMDRFDRDDSEGVGIRVRRGGAWGFAATADTARPDLDAALARALAVLDAQPTTGGAALAPEAPVTGVHESRFEIHPFDVSLADKLEILAGADAALRAQPGVSVSVSELFAFDTRISFASSEGARASQHLVECGGGISATATGELEAQVRSYPGSHGGGVAQAGFEYARGLDLAAHAPRVAEEAVALLTAPACPSEPTDLVLAGEQLAIQIHESVGHAVELDRVLGREASYAGVSFVGADAIGSLRYGSEHMNVTADATAAGGIGSFRFDDEGVAGQKVPIVRDGVLVGFLSSRETAAEIGLARSGGAMRADGYARQPLVRMTNVSLDPGVAGTVGDLLADTEDGVYLDTNRSWSIDSRRLNFRFEGEAAYEIRGGVLGRLLRNPSYGGRTPEFWARLDAVCSPAEWQLYSVLNCGKGEPGQIARVSHGSAPARFRGVTVGGA